MSEDQSRSRKHQRCQEEVKRLTEENTRLRQSAEALGEIAERLNRELRSAREPSAADAEGPDSAGQDQG
jgi:predicted RNase H-like nuclease (RuvC/YqgF family)